MSLQRSMLQILLEIMMMMAADGVKEVSTSFMRTDFVLFSNWQVVEAALV